MKKILITGGTGLVGSYLTRMLLAQNMEVVHLSRRSKKDGLVKTYQWDPYQGMLEEGALEGITHIVHLAGSNVAEKRWTAQRKAEIIDSRVKTSAFLLEQLQAKGQQLEGYISASGINFYGNTTSDQIFTENDPQGPGFLAECVKEWEAIADAYAAIAPQVVKLRIGAVIAKEDGIYPKVSGPIKAGIGSPLGSGEQWVPWVHVEDVAGAIAHFIAHPALQGVYNTIAKEHITNADLTKALAEHHNKKLWAPKVPAFVLKLMLGELAEIPLEGSRASNEQLLQVGYTFKYPELKGALESLRL